MPRNFKHGQVEILDSPVLICFVPQDITATKVLNTSDDVTVYIGSDDVAADGENIGFPIQPGTSQDLFTYPHDVTGIYAVVTEGETATVIYLTSE